jgi:AbrB family looped-hinge helix DNA binding protein
MSQMITVKVSKRNQIAVPAVAREKLNIQSGDRLIVDVQDGMLILLPKPNNFTDALAGLHKEIWEGIDTDQYIEDERAAWTDSEN